MKLIMSKQEFLDLRDIIIGLDNEKVTAEFNRICTNKNSKIDTASTPETFTFTVSEDLSVKIGNVLKTYSKGLGRNLSISLTNLPKLFGQLKKLAGDLGAAIKGSK